MILTKKSIFYMAVLLIVAFLVTAIIVSTQKNDPIIADKSASTPSPDVTVTPADTLKNTITPAVTPVPETPEVTTPEVTNDISTATPKPTVNKTDTPKTPAKKNEMPVKTIKPTQPGGIIIGDDLPTETIYDCKTPNHHCANAENHAFIANLELKGCPYCGSHSCPSFYALDEWGFTCYDVTKCPEYDEKKDPVIYCQECGKKTGDGTNGTCVQFLKSCYCPNCGEYVEANTCHTCK